MSPIVVDVRQVEAEEPVDAVEQTVVGQGRLGAATDGERDG